MSRLRRVLPALVLLAAISSDAPGAPPYKVVKTVGVEPPPACANTTSITVGKGTTVWYCYEFTNLSTGITRYNLIDNRLGTIVFNATVPAGGTDRRFASVVTNSGNSSITNVATWTLTGGPILANSTASVDIVDLANIPALAPPGLVALGAALLLAGFALLRRLG